MGSDDCYFCLLYSIQTVEMLEQKYILMPAKVGGLWSACTLLTIYTLYR